MRSNVNLSKGSIILLIITLLRMFDIFVSIICDQHKRMSKKKLIFSTAY